MINNDEDVSLYARFKRFPYWNAVLETEFLENLVRPYSSNNRLGCKNFFDHEVDNDENDHLQVMKSKYWSLSLKENEICNLTDDHPETGSSESGTENNIYVKVNKRLLETKKQVIRNQMKKYHKKYLDKKDNGSIHWTKDEDEKDDWSDLFLVQKALNKEMDVDADRNPDVNDKDEEELVYDLDLVEKLVNSERNNSGEGCAEYRSNTIRDEIKRKIQDSSDRHRTKMNGLIKLSKNFHPVAYPLLQDIKKKVKMDECRILMEDDVKLSCSSVKNPSGEAYNLRNRSKKIDYKNEKKETSETSRQKRRFLWYEQKPFDDPVKEAKRLRSLSQKIYDDKRRFDFEILKAENKDLREENERLREELKKFASIKVREISEEESDDEESVENPADAEMLESCDIFTLRNSGI